MRVGGFRVRKSGFAFRGLYIVKYIVHWWTGERTDGRIDPLVDGGKDASNVYSGLSVALIC